MIDEGQVKRLNAEPNRRFGHRSIWTGAGADILGQIQNELPERVEDTGWTGSWQ